MSECIGGIEILADGAWFLAVRVEAFLRGDNQIIESLFCRGNSSGFEPLFPSRGVPPSSSVEFVDLADSLTKVGARIESISWVSHSEMCLVPWEEIAKKHDQRIHKYEVSAGGLERPVSRALDYPDSGIEELRSGRTDFVSVGTFVYRRVFLKRSDLVIDTDFNVLFDVGKLLAARYGSDHVRWVFVFAE